MTAAYSTPTDMPTTTARKLKTPVRRARSVRPDSDLFGKHKPDPHQEISLAHADENERVLDFSDPGTGKTPVALWAYAKRRRAGLARCALVFCPRTLTKNVWANSVRKFTPNYSTVIAKAENREKAFAEDVDIYITNTDAAKWLAKQKKPFFARFTDLIIDESSKFKHHTSQRSRALAKIAKHFTARRLLTGTPSSRSITDVWHQAYVCDDGQRLGNSFYAFRNAVSNPVQVGRNANAIHWTDKDGAEEAVFGMLSDIVLRHRFEDVVKIPERRIYTIEYEMTPKHAKAYFELEKNQVLLAMGKNKGGMISAIHAAALRQKLLQCASGATYLDGIQANKDRPTHIFDTGRYELVMDLAEESPHSLVMFLWRHQRDALVQEAEKRNLTYAVMDANTSDTTRENIEADYQAGKYDVVIAHPDTVAHGLTFTRGAATIWSSPTDNTEWFKQGNRRQARRGQTQKTRVVTVIATGTFDERAYDNCVAKGEREDNLLELFAKYTDERFVGR